MLALQNLDSGGLNGAVKWNELIKFSSSSERSKKTM